MSFNQMSICRQCSAPVDLAGQVCLRCGESLDDERAVFFRRQATRAADNDPAPQQPQPTQQRPPSAGNENNYLDTPSGPAADESRLLPVEPLEIAPNPLIGPLLRRFTRYYLSRETLRVQTGIFARHFTQLEWWRVGIKSADMRAKSGPLQMMRGTGNIYIMSSDPDTPSVVLRDIPDFERVKTLIQKTAEYQQMRRARWNIGGGGFAGMD